MEIERHTLKLSGLFEQQNPLIYVVCVIRQKEFYVDVYSLNKVGWQSLAAELINRRWHTNKGYYVFARNYFDYFNNNTVRYEHREI